MQNRESKTATIVLEDGSMFGGCSVGFHPPSVENLSVDNMVCAELVFNTAMTGYVEILTDPSYLQQMVLLTTAHVGNYGVDIEWSQRFRTANSESVLIPSALIVHDLYRGVLPEGRISLERFLYENKRPLIAQVDTRGLTRHIREHGAQQAMLVLGDKDTVAAHAETILGYILHSNHIEGSDVAGRAGVSKRVCLTPSVTGVPDLDAAAAEQKPQSDTKLSGKQRTPGVSQKPAEGRKIVCIDCGVKQNILASFAEYERVLLPSTSTAQEILSESPDAVLISNGPGDPSGLEHCIDTVRSLIGKTLLFGICFGHQIIARALGAKTYKLPFGHHGANHAVRDEITKRVHVVCENHGFAVDANTLPDFVFPWFTNTSDGTLEGIYSDSLKIYSVQFHPEAGPGPNDAQWIFSYFKKQI